MTQVLENLFEEDPILVDNYEFFVLLQPTSPLRTKNILRKHLKKVEKNGISDSLISGIEVDNSGLKSLIQRKNGLQKK